MGNLITQHTAVSFSLTKHFFGCLAPSLGVIKWGCNNSSETCTLKKKKKREAEKWESVFRIKKRWWSIMAVTSSTTSRRSYMVEGLHFDDLRISWSCWLHQLLTCTEMVHGPVWSSGNENQHDHISTMFLRWKRVECPIIVWDKSMPQVSQGLVHE